MSQLSRSNASPSAEARRFHLAIYALALSGLFVLLSGCDFFGSTQRENRSTGPDDVSVVPEMLVGARYRGRTGGGQHDDLTWEFDRTKFRILAGRGGLPADLAKALLPPGVTGYRIDGHWSVDGEILTVSNLTLDGEPVGDQSRTLRAMCTPVIRIQADKHQYMFDRGTAESAWRQADIPPWPPETACVLGSVKFDDESQGWLSTGYRGLVEQSAWIGDDATLEIQPGRSSGFAQTRTFAPRFCRLQLDGGRRATMRCMGLPPGVYLFYAAWKSRDVQARNEKIVVDFTRWRLQGRFLAKWVVVGDRPLSHIAFDFAAARHGGIAIRVPASDSRQSVFLLPWGQPGTEPPPLDSDKAWQVARWAGNQLPVETESGKFSELPTGRYRLFLVEHDEPMQDEDTLIEYRVKGDKTVTVQPDEVVEMSF